MSGVARVLVTESEFLALPESMERAELIDGEVCVSPSPSFWHQELLTRIVMSLREWVGFRQAAMTVCQAPLDLRLGPGRIVQPDAFVVPGRVPADHEGPIDEIPVLCVEVLSTNRVYDRVFKRMLYADAGVAEFWLVESDGSVERFTGEGLKQGEFSRDELTSVVLAGFKLDLSRLR